MLLSTDTTDYKPTSAALDTKDYMPIPLETACLKWAHVNFK